MKFHALDPLSRIEAEGRLTSVDAEILGETLLRISLYDPDQEWVLSQLERASRHPNSELRSLVATCVGHVARVHRNIDLARAGALLDELAKDPSVAPTARDAWEDLELFVGREGKIPRS